VTLFLSIMAILALLALWGLAWRNRPILAFGIFLGTVGICVLAAIVRPSGLDHIPVWLPALPFAVVAVALFYFGILAWWWGRDRS
jgi:hypothetical protein